PGVLAVGHDARVPDPDRPLPLAAGPAGIPEHAHGLLGAVPADARLCGGRPVAAGGAGPPPPPGGAHSGTGPRHTRWGRLAVGTLATLAAIVPLAGVTNGDRTMRAANTRWPVWTWTDGPFPGR